MSESEREREKLVERIREDLRKQACYITAHTIRRIIDAYDARVPK